MIPVDRSQDKLKAKRNKSSRDMTMTETKETRYAVKNAPPCEFQSFPRYPSFPPTDVEYHIYI